MTQTFVAISIEPSPPAPVWPAFVAAALVLLAAAFIAWWRVHAGGLGQPRRRIRIFAAATMGGVAATVLMTASAAARKTGMFGWTPYETSPGAVMFFQLLGYVLLAGAMVGTGDLLFDALRPSRSRLWLVAGAPLFGTFIVATLYATGSVGPLDASPTIKQGALVVSALVASLIWWAWLPAPKREIAGVFE